MYFIIFKDNFTFSRAILQNSRTIGTILKFQEFSRTKVKFKDFSRSVQTLGCERKIEVFVKIKKKKFWGGGGGSGGSVGGGGVGGGVRVDVNEELKFL